MEIVKAFTDNNLCVEITIMGSYTDPLFKANDIGEILEIINIRSNIKNFDNTEKVMRIMETSTGSKQIAFLTEKGLYKILFKSRKPIAEKFQNWVCEVIKEIRLNSVYDLQKQMEEKIIEHKELENERVLLDKFGSIGNVIYIIKVKTLDNGKYVIKIGESRKGVSGRYNEHKCSYDECLLLNCFSVDKSSLFENFLHHHSEIYPSKVTNLFKHESENELFLIGEQLSYRNVLKIIEDNIDKFNYKVSELILENKLLKLDNELTPTMNNELLNQLFEMNKLLLNKVCSLENSVQILLSEKNKEQTNLVTGFGEQLPHLGPRLQKINPENLQLVKVYECVTEAMNEDKTIKRPSINKAINENTIYRGFRWLLVERNLDPSIIHSIEPTKEIKHKNCGYLAKLNQDKSEILNVYLDRKTTCFLNGHQSPSALDISVKNGSLSNGNYYILYDNCDEDLINNFETQYGSPILYKDGVGQYNENNELVCEYKCKYDCMKELKMSDKTLAKALSNDTLYNGYYYRKLGSKLSML